MRKAKSEAEPKTMMESSAYQSASSQTTRGLGRSRTAYPRVNESIAYFFDLPIRVCVGYTWKCVFWAEGREIYNFQQPHVISPTPNGEYAIRHIKDGWADQKAHSYAYICTRSNWMFKVKEGRGGRVRTQPERGSSRQIWWEQGMEIDQLMNGSQKLCRDQSPPNPNLDTEQKS